MRKTIVLLFLSGCQTAVTIFPATPKPETVYDPPPMFEYAVVYDPPDHKLMNQWVKLWRDMGYSEAESRLRATQMMAVK